MLNLPPRSAFRAGHAFALAVAMATLERPASALDFGSALAKFMYDDAVATFHVRSYYFDRTNPRPPNNVAWATGGWVGYETGWLYDTLQLGTVGYTTQPIWAPPENSGSQLLKPGQYGFAVLGIAFASIRAKDQVFTGYRQLIDEMEVNPDDGRMIPNTFEAYALRGELGKVTYFAGYVAAMKPRGSPVFVNMAERAGAPDVNAGMWLGSVKYGSSDHLRLRASGYHVPDILTSGYADVVRTFHVAEKFDVRAAGNAMVQGSNGLNLLTDKPFSTWSAGGRVDLFWRHAQLWGAYTQTGSAAAYRAPYGQWMGFTKQMTKDFNRANERAFQVGVGYNFIGLGIPGLTFQASATFGERAINVVTGAQLPNINEYDFDLIYMIAPKTAPEWLQRLQLRARAGFVDEALNGVTRSGTEYRLILNYEVTFSRRDRRRPG